MDDLVKKSIIKRYRELKNSKNLADQKKAEDIKNQYSEIFTEEDTTNVNPSSPATNITNSPAEEESGETNPEEEESEDTDAPFGSPQPELEDKEKSKTAGQSEAEALQQKALEPAGNIPGPKTGQTPAPAPTATTPPEQPPGGPAIAASDKTEKEKTDGDGGEGETKQNQKIDETKNNQQAAPSDQKQGQGGVGDWLSQLNKSLGQQAKKLLTKEFWVTFGPWIIGGLIIAIILVAIILFAVNYFNANSRVHGGTQNEVVSVSGNADTVNQMMTLANVSGINSTNETQILNGLSDQITAIEADPKVDASVKSQATELIGLISTEKATPTKANRDKIIAKAQSILEFYYPAKKILRSPYSDFFTLDTGVGFQIKDSLQGAAVKNANGKMAALQPELGKLLAMIYDQRTAIGIPAGDKITVEELVGNPIATSGSSLHTTGQAVDIVASDADMKSLQTWLFNNFNKTGAGTMNANGIYIYEVEGPNLDLWIQRMKQAKGTASNNLLKNSVHIGISLTPDKLTLQSVKSVK